MERKNGMGILGLRPSFRSGIMAMLVPGRKVSELRKAVTVMRQNDGLCEDWQAVGGDLRAAIGKYNSGMTWQKK